MALKIIGAGYGRTATASLKYALETLLGEPCYHMSEVLGKPGHVDLWLDAASGKPNWDAIFDGFGATVDFPAASYWRELADAFPEAKILLSTRDPESWYRSTQETIFSSTLESLYQGTKWGRMMQATITDHLGSDLSDHDRLVEAFQAHSEAVKSAFGPDRLLVFQAREGWGPLCEFLGVSQPDEPFPHVNSTEEFNAVFELLRSPLGPAVMNGEGIETQGSMHDEVFER